MDKKGNQIGKIHKFYNRLSNKDISDFFTSGIAIILTIILFCNLVAYCGGIRAIYEYPEAEYQYLSTEINKVIVDNSIDMKQISDDAIAHHLTYIVEAGESEWSSCEIELSNSEATVNATVTKNANNTLNMDVTYDSRIEHYVGVIIMSLIILVILLVASYVISCICYSIFLCIVWILKSIEKFVLRRKKI